MSVGNGANRFMRDVPAQQSAEWEDAARLAGRIVQPGPDVSRAKAIETVEVLRASAQKAAPLAARLSKMQAADGRVIDAHTLSRIYVVDRPSWALGAARSIHQMLGLDTQEPVPGEPDASDIASGVELTAVLTFLSRKTLGQFDPFGPSMGLAVTDRAWPLSTADPRGNLLLVAPNILSTQRAMVVDFSDFALWVALHEQTHALQFAAAPWLVPYLQGLTNDLITAFPTESRLRDWSRSAASVLRGGNSIVDSILTAEQGEIFAKITTAMSILEGHADVVMDLVSSRDIADVAVLRRKFNSRRTSSTKRGDLIMRLSGMNAKMDQYRNGAKFVRSVRRSAGMAGVNSLWHSPEHFPTPVELDRPADWIARVAK